VVCFFNDLLLRLEKEGQLKPVGALKCETGSLPIYQLEHQGQNVLVFHPGVGAPLAGGFLDEVISTGVKNFFVCGGCGVLQKDIAAGHVIIITSAVRDEGTSYHYLPPSREAAASPRAVDALEETCRVNKIPYLLGKSWTTDAIYRETEAKRAMRIAEGCLTVEMEASALFAIAAFRGVELGQILYGGDLVVPEGWDKRDWLNRHDVREQLFWIAVEAALQMDVQQN
jgi:uridine phosphorylase